MFDSSLLKIIVVFTLILVLTRFKISLWLSILIGIVGLNFWNHSGLGYFSALAQKSFLSMSTLMLSLSVLLILQLSRLMKESGSMEKIVDTYRGLLPWPSVSLMTLPMMVGMLPMPGGAIFSAPLVDAYDPKHLLSSEEKAATNFWFRHTLELTWPLYFAFIFITEITDIQPIQLILVNWIFVPVLMFSGYLFLLRHHSFAHISRKKENYFEFLHHLLPILLAIVFYFIFSMILSGLKNPFPENEYLWNTIIRYLPIVLGLCVAITYLLLNRPDLRKLAFKIINKKNLSLVWTVVVIKFFSSYIQHSDLAVNISKELNNFHIPGLGIIAFLPFLAGLVTGVGFAYVGITFPIIMLLFPSELSSLEFLAYVMLADVMGYIGMMLSPLHVCMVLTAEYFHIPLSAIIKKMILPSLLTLIFTFLYFFFLITLF